MDVGVWWVDDVGWCRPCRFMKSISVLICVKRPEENAAIWECRYIRNASLVQRPCFQMVSRPAPLSFRAIAPPEQREWLPTVAGE